MSKRIAIFSDKFDSSLTSAGQIMSEFVIELSKYSDLMIDVYTFESSDDPIKKRIDYSENITINRIQTNSNRNSSLFFRFINELSISFIVLYHILKEKKFKSFENIIWYSPTIFWGPLILVLKIFNKTKNVLILRDIFPQWAVDLEIIKRYSIEYYLLRFFELLQYRAADIIAIQSDGNKEFFNKKSKSYAKLITLKTWFRITKDYEPLTNPNLAEIPFDDKKICIYAGNLGLAQDQNLLLNIFKNINDDEHHFLLIGQKKSDRNTIMKLSKSMDIKNLTVTDTISVKELNTVLLKSHLGIFSLDVRHTTHNIPGKFLHYISVGLPVFGICNKNNDVNDIIRNNNLGSTYCGNDAKEASIDFLNLSGKISRKLFKKESIQAYVKNELCPKKTTSKVLNFLD